MQNILELKSINDILKYKFYIPSYQRGYRWTALEVTDLLKDIWEFKIGKRTNDEFYPLQPVIVKERDGVWELIDGQQRLTTIFIILTVLQKKKFTIEFETRERSADFLNNLSDNVYDDTNVDYYNICEAYKVVKEWFDKNEDDNPTIREEFFIELGRYTQIIWYVIKNGDPRDIFTRINVGKIPLTNAELIKALFLNSGNFSANPDVDIDRVKLKQLEIATEWDRIEYTLQDDDFWLFINREYSDKATRIEFIFDLIASNSSKDDRYLTFRYFNDKFINNAGIDTVWREIKEYFLTLDEWFNDPELYNLIGYLIVFDYKINDIKSQSQTLSKTDFVQYLHNEIKKKVNYQIDSLDFVDNNPNKAIEKILLLFNIETLISQSDSPVKFPFKKYKGNENGTFRWSLEHIHAQKSKGLDTSDRRKKWLAEAKESIGLIEIDYDNEMQTNVNTVISEVESLLASSTVEASSFDDVQRKIFQLFGDVDLHGIDNLTLLTINDNSTLNNSIFPIKRKKIIELEKKGSFIPICTRNVFLKYYTPNATHLHFWGENDRKNYIQAIKNTLIDYLPN